MRGPAAMPASIARLSPKVGPAMSRTLVNPRISVFPASTAATRLMYPTSAVISTFSGDAAIMACQWASMSPGISTRPPQSTIRTLASSAPSAGPTALMILPLTTTLRPLRNAFDLPSNTRTLVKAMGASDGADARVEALPDPAANALNVALAPGRGENFSARRLFSRAKAGVWQKHPAE